MIRLTQQELDSILADFLGKPYCRGGSGPDGYDCYGLTRAFMSKIGIEIADIGKVDPKDSRPIYERQQTDFIRLPVPRPWSLVTFSSKSLDAHIGVVLPGDGVFLHCPGRAAGRVLAEPLSRRPWRDCVDGYWWPKGYIETIVLLTPMTTTKKAWQFVKTGRCLAEIVEQDITEGRDVQVQVFLGGELIPQEKWIHTVPTEMDQIVVRPLMEGGKQAGMMAGMMALAVLAPYAAGAIVPAVAAGTATAGQVFAYNLASAAIMMGGGLALSALVNANEGDRNPSQHYSAEPQTTAGIGSFIPLVYGTFGVRGVLICSYASSSYTTAVHLWRKETIIHHASNLYHAKIALSDGPIDGIIAGTEKLNDRDLEYYSGDDGFKIEYFNGTDDQSASSILDAFEIPVSLDCPTNEPVTKLFTAVDCDSAAIVLRFPNGITDYDSDGSSGFTQVQLKVEIRIAEGSWHTLMNGYIKGDSQDPMRYNIDLAGSHEGGTPFYIVAGTQYEAKVTRLSNTHSDKGDNFLFECIQFGYNTAQKHPGLAYTAIGAMASKDISGSIQYYAKIKGKLVRVYDSDTETWSIEWSDNPAWIAYDILTRPVISGNGESATPYYVEYYRRLNPSYLNLSDFVAFADWCDEEVPDGQGGVEKRYVFNGVFDQDNTAWEQAIRVCRVGCAAPFFRGHRIGIVIDKPGLPSQMFNVSNLRSGFNETWFDTSEAATVFDVSFANEQGEYIVEPYPVPLAGAELDIPVTMDGFGHTKRTQVWRRATRDLRVNHYMKRTVEIPACLDSIYTDLGQIVYVQHPALNRAVGGRILEVYADGIKFDKPVVMLGTGLVGHWRLNDCAADTDVVDSSGNGRTGTATHNTSTLSVPGKVGGCFKFDKTVGNYVTVPGRTEWSLASGGTVCFWLRWGGVNASVNNARPRVVHTSAWTVYLTGIADLRFRIGAEETICQIPVNEWVHVAVQVQASGHKIYLNGEDATASGGITTLPASSNPVFWIGAYSSTQGFLNDHVDDVRLYNRVLSEEEIAALYNRGFGTEEEGAADHALLVRTHDGTAERLNLYEVASVGGSNLDIITINGAWEYTPNENDLATFGVEEKVIDLYRVKAVERDSNGQVLIRGTQYTTDFYSEDEDAPKVQAQVYSETKGGISPTLLPTTAEALKISLPDASSSLGTLTWSGLAFTGDGVDTVTWECTGSGIKYQGTWVPIEDDAVGTTDKYIYFDPDPDSVGDPRYLQHTNDLADLRGFERYVMCLNINGVAYPKSGLLIGADGKTIDADDISDGSRGLKEFHDYFQDPHGTFAVRWPNATPNGITMSIEAGGASGDNLLRIASDGSGNALLTYRNSIPFDPGYLYRVRARIRANSGTPLVSIGLAGRNATDAAWVNTAGNNLQTVQHYAACFEHEPASSWEVVTGYIYGLDATGTEESSSDPENPGKMHTNVRWFRPTIVVNFQSASGVVDIDELNVDVMPPTMGSVRPTVTDQGAVGDGVIDDTNALRTAIAAAILSKRPVILPKGTYRITDTIEIGDGLSVVTGLTIQAEGWESAKILWDGDPDKNMIEILSCNGLVLDNIWFDGNNVSGVSGVYHSTGAAASSQFTTIRQCGVVNCPGVGYHIEQWSPSAACDYFSFDNCALGYNGINLKIVGGARQVEMYGGANINAATYGVEVDQGRFTVYDGLFALNGYDAVAKERTGCDIYMSGLISQIQVFGASSESLRFLDGNWAADAGSSRLLSANVIHNLNQADRGDMPVGELKDPAAIDVTINYDCPRPLILTGCKVMGDIAVGSKCSSIQSIHTDFYNYERPSTSGDPITGFIGAGVSKVNIIGRTDNSEGTGEGSLSSTTILGGGRFLVVEDGWLKGIDLLDDGGTIYRRMGFSAGPPDTYYARQGWIMFAVNPTEAGALGWVCTEAGVPTTTKAVFKAFGTNLIGASVTNYARNSILTAVDAAALQAALSFGTMAAQNANNVNISGGAIAGITDLAVADGGTGASTAAGAASNLGLGTEDSPQFTAINVGHASDTAIARASAGNITVAGNAIYRAGGTDVPVTDGGTGSSTAAGARGNLGIGAIATLADAPTAITSNTDAASGDSGKHYTNTGASGSIYVKFPAATAGMIFAATRTASQAFWIKPYTDEQFRGQVANKYLELTSDGMTVICKCIQTGIWDIVAAGLGTTAWIGP